jgi:glycosyltransferase involved in cell wall biosynthesis
VIPIYESLLRQTYQNWEWVVTDDFSDDSSYDILMEIAKKDERVKYITQKHKQEMYWNPHKFSSLDSDFILHLGSDDILYPKVLEVYKHFFLKMPEIFTIISGGVRVKEDTNKLKNFLYCHVNDLDSFDYRTKNGNDHEKLFITKCWRHIPYPTLDFNPNNKYQQRLEDLNILLKLEEINNVLCLNRNLCDITIRNISLSNSPKLTHQTSTTVKKTAEDIYSDVDDRRKGGFLYPLTKINKEETNITDCFYYGDLSKSSKFETVNILNNNFNKKYKKIIKDIYFEYNIKFENYSKVTDKNYYIIDNDHDYKYFIDNKKEILSYKNVILFLVHNRNNDEIIDIIKKNYLMSWFKHNHTWINIKN